MRKFVKFKNYKRIENISCAHRLSFYNLKRTKWDLVRRRLLGAAARKKFLKVKSLNLYKVKRETRFWGKISTQHRQHFSLIKKLEMSQSSSIANNFYFKHSKNYQQRLLNFFIRSSLKLDTLLWLSGIFVTTKIARLHLILGTVSLNYSTVFKPVFLKKNDLIQIQYTAATNLKQKCKLSSFFYYSFLFKIKKLIIKKYILKKKKRKFKLKTFFFQFKKKISLSLRKIKKVAIVKKRNYPLFRHILSFLEIDLYSKQFVVIKDLSRFSFTDVCLSAKEYFDVQQL
jgi:hypothetical protein